MGIFINENGHFKGWLAAFLCCFAAVDIDEHPIEWSTSKPSVRPGMATYNEQILPTSTPVASDTHQRSTITSHSSHSAPSLDGSREWLTEQPSLPKAISLESGNTDMVTAEPSQQANKHHSQISRMSRRLDSEIHRHSLVPLKLAPVTLRSPSNNDLLPNDPLPHLSQHHLRSESTQNLLPQTTAKPPSEIRSRPRESPYQRLQRQSADFVTNRQSQLLSSYSTEDLPLHAATEQQSTLHLSAQSSLSSLYRSDTSPSLKSRSSTIELNTPTRIRRKHSGPLSSRGDDVDLGTDKDAIELNTIQEENKSESPRPTTAKSEGHIPAVAPHMQIHARSETLDDIGSILSRPIGTKESKDFDTLLEEASRQSRSTATATKARSRSSSRVSGWLSNIRTPSIVSTPQPSMTDSNTWNRPAMPGRARTQSRVSHSSSITNLDSPSVTAASSPISKSHSRSLTAESRITSPPSTIQEVCMYGRSRDSTIARTERVCEDEGWPSLVHSSSEVGLAF